MDTDELQKKLNDYGADVAGAMARFLDDAELYETCVRLFLTDENFDALTRSVEKRDSRAAFEAAHTLKGVAANLGLTPLLCAVNELVEPLRRGECEGLEERLAEVTDAIGSLRTLLAEE